MSQFDTVLVFPSRSSVTITYLIVSCKCLSLDDKFYCQLATEPTEMGMVLRQKQDLDCWAGRLGVGKAINVGAL